MCDAVVSDVSPENATCTVRVFRTVSIVTIAFPVPVDALGGDSFGPVKDAVATMILACEMLATAAGNRH
jgi:hypothetical protein